MSLEHIGPLRAADEGLERVTEVKERTAPRRYA